MSSVTQNREQQELPLSGDDYQRRHQNRRQHERRYFSVPVRFMCNDRHEHAGMLVDIGIGGARIQSHFIPLIDETIIVYIDHIGRFEGVVLRRSDEEFAMRMTISPAKCDRLENAIRRFFAEQIPDAKLSDRRLKLSDRRQAARQQVAGRREITANMDDNIAFRCVVENISLTGIEISTSAQLDLGQRVTVGRFEGRVVRKTKAGYALTSQ